MRSSRLRTVMTILLVLAALALVFVAVAPDPALARAGGGEKFPSGGGGGGGEGSYGGGGDSDGIATLIIWLVIYSPIPWPIKIVIIVAVLVGGGLMGKKRVSRGRGAVADDGYYSAPAFQPAAYSAPPMPAPNLLAGLAELKARDPGFSGQAFEDLASTAFYKIQEAWSEKNMSIARAFTSPTLIQRFETQVAELKKAGRTNVIEDLTVGALEIVEASSDGMNHYVTVKIQAAAADYTVDDKTGQVLFGAKQIKPFTEYWTFLRSRDVKTKAGKESESKHCPNCGAPISLNAVGKCDYCGSDITSGKFSWVLAEISQASAWRPRTQAVRPPTVSPLAGERYVLGLVQCPNCGANVQDILGVTEEKCWRCGSVVPTAK